MAVPVEGAVVTPIPVTGTVDSKRLVAAIVTINANNTTTAAQIS